MAELIAYLRFGGNCREAMEFYESCLGGKLDIMEVGGSPAAAHMPPGMEDKVLHATLVREGMILMASDMSSSEGVVPGNAVSLCITASNRQEIEPYFVKLSDGGRVTTPLNEEFFGTYGDLTDRFGIQWMFQAGGPPA